MTRTNTLIPALVAGMVGGMVSAASTSVFFIAGFREPLLCIGASTLLGAYVALLLLWLAEEER